MTCLTDVETLKDELRDALQILRATPLFEDADEFYLKAIAEAEKLDVQLAKDNDVLLLLEGISHRLPFRMENLKKQYEEECSRSEAAGAMSEVIASLRSRTPQPIAPESSSDEGPATVQDEDDMTVVEVVRSHKDPLGGGLIKDPIKSKFCGHVYDRTTLQQYIADNKARHNACYQCPYSLCKSKRNMNMNDMVDYPEFLSS